ncbi:MAG: phage associated protein [Holophagaceae bacterium]|nr:phage associated protein [Holophagaceae bacterium]
MTKRKPLIDKEGEVRELSLEDMKAFRPIQDLAPPSLLHKLRVRGPQKTPTKEQINIRLSKSVLESFRATGEGWQTRIDEALQDWLKAHKPA